MGREKKGKNDVVSAILHFIHTLAKSCYFLVRPEFSVTVGTATEILWAPVTRFCNSTEIKRNL